MIIHSLLWDVTGIAVKMLEQFLIELNKIKDLWEARVTYPTDWLALIIFNQTLFSPCVFGLTMINHSLFFHDRSPKRES